MTEEPGAGRVPAKPRPETGELPEATSPSRVSEAAAGRWDRGADVRAERCGREAEEAAAMPKRP